MTLTPTVVLWIYIVLLVAGGLMGLVKAGSKISLMVSVAFAAALSWCAMNLWRLRPSTNALVADLILIVLLVFFGMRFAKSKKFMPMGMMCILTVVTLAARRLL